jgi:thymidine kinase
MAKLYFYYSAMNAGKTTTLLQSDFNYQERGMNTLCLLPTAAADFQPQITSRIGLSKPAVILQEGQSVFGLVQASHQNAPLACVLVDEAQFLLRPQVEDLCLVVDRLDIPVLAYGLRTDFRGNLFQGSQHLLAWADHLHEIKTICFCGAKAIMTARLDAGSGQATLQGDQIQCGGNELYVALCRHHHTQLAQGTLAAHEVCPPR